MAAISPTLPVYLNHFVHPGLYSPVNLTQGFTEVNPKYENLFAQIMGSYLPRIPSSSNPFTDKEITALKLASWSTLKTKLMTPIDRAVTGGFCSDRECHETMLKGLEPYLAIDLSTLTEDDVQKILREIHTGLFAPQTGKSFAGPYRAQDVIINKFLPANFFVYNVMSAYLTKAAPEEVIIYHSLMSKLQKYSHAQVEFDMYSFVHGEALTAEENALINKYVIFTPRAYEVTDLMHSFILELLSRLQAKQNPIAIAAFVHMQIVIIHPYENGNGRVARTMMNLILAHAGLPPISFPSNEEYIQAVSNTRNGNRDFEDLIRKKVEESKEDYAGDPAIVEAKLAARAIQAVWERIPKDRMAFIIESSFLE